MSFSEFSFDARLMRNIAAQGFTAPTPIQGMAMGPALEGKDVLGLAQTGTGKTAAFVLPLLQRLIEANAPRRGPARVLVLAPTRELALQIHQTFIDLGRNTGFRSAAVFGGVGYGPQVKALSQASIIVACPGRLLDLIDRKQVNLSRVEALVADEADRMFDMGFLPDIKKIVAQLPDQRQNLFFSATMPQEVKKLFNAVLVDPFVAKISLDGPAKTVSHALYPVAPHLKTAFLTTMLKGQDHQSVLVFTRTKHRAKTLARKLCAQGFPATSLQGNLSQNKRREALDGFRKGKYQIMVATDIAARGIDCDRISHVVNFDVPDTADSYTHRVGRTGR
ncbi:MAG: DEAD/DEAH box helicase, partial [Desulfovibrio sp.]